MRHKLSDGVFHNCLAKLDKTVHHSPRSNRKTNLSAFDDAAELTSNLSLNYQLSPILLYRDNVHGNFAAVHMIGPRRDGQAHQSFRVAERSGNQTQVSQR